MKVETVSLDNLEAVTVEGAVDLYSSPKLREVILKLAGQKTSPLAIHLENVEYIDSSGVATLVEALQLAQKYGGKVVLVAVSEKVRDVLQLAHLDSIFTMVPSFDEVPR